MRGARWLLLLVMVAIVGAVGVTYRAQKKVLKQQAPPKPAALPAGVGAVAEHWEYRRNKNNDTQVQITARDFRQEKDAADIYLTEVELRLHHEKTSTYDLVTSPAATFSSNDERLYSDGQVDITLAIPDGQQPNPNLVSIHSTGVSFDTNTGKSDTERPATFTFRNGSGKAVGASYDPNAHELILISNVEMLWNPPGPHAKPMKIETERLYYHEATSEVWLKSWGRMTRDNTVVEGYENVVHLEDKAIRSIETNRAHGRDDYPNRKVQYAADNIWTYFDDDGEVQKIAGQGNARLTSTGETAETTITASNVEMDFAADPDGGQSALSQVKASGNSVVKERPLPAAGREPAESHILRSDTVEMKMRSGGKDIETIQCHGPGTLEFLPNVPAQHHRILTGKEMLITYAPQNRIESFRAQDVKTDTDPTEDERRRNRAVTNTASRTLLAHFDPATSQIISMEQDGDFTYEEGVRRARAAKATLDSKNNVMLLDTGARVSDDTGSTSADHIRTDQRTGDFTAEGNVNSIRLPEKGRAASTMLSGDEPIQAQARKMSSTNRNRTFHYEGSVTLSQGANHIQANVVDVDREKQTMVADGNVVTNLWEQPKDDGTKAPKAPVLTVVHAPHLVYTDSDRLAVYTGGVLMNRPAMQVKSKELRAYLAEEGSDSRLVKALADGSVEIAQKAADRTRTGTAEHCEYYADTQKVILRGGDPQFVDSLKGNAHGVELTYFANDDRLLVNGSPQQPARSRIRRK